MITPRTALLVPRARLKGLHPRDLRGQGQPWELGGEGHPLPWGYEETRPCPRGRSLLCLDGCLWGPWTCPDKTFGSPTHTVPHPTSSPVAGLQEYQPPCSSQQNWHRLTTGPLHGLSPVYLPYSSAALSSFRAPLRQTCSPCLATASLSTPSSALFLFIII